MSIPERSPPACGENSVCMARGPQNVVPTRILAAYVEERPEDRSKWLRENRDRFPKSENKAAEKAWAIAAPDRTENNPW
jgi:hypothetical protein